MDAETGLWFGTLNGMHVVYDPEIQVPGSRWVLLFQARRNCLIPYHKPHARSVLHALSDPDSRVGVLAAYRAWRLSAAQSTLNEAMNDIRRKDKHLEEKQANAIAKHRRSLEKMSISYRGVAEPDGRGIIRNTVCRGCHRAIGTDAHLVCKRCGWIACLNCGTCGCGYLQDGC
jgi:hypothetical protein